MPSQVVLAAPAKVNLYLAVHERTSDGYHRLSTVFQALDDRLSDVVRLSPATGFSVSMSPDVGVPETENLAFRAAVSIAREAGVADGLEVFIEKRIPAGGGLGGASADAAAVLVGACALWGLDPSSEQVLGIARRLGADVAFFLAGGTALYGGRGDVRERDFPTPEIPLVVATAGEPVPTGAAYALLDRMPRPPAPRPERLFEALIAKDASGIGAALHNDLAPVAKALVPSVAEVESWLAHAEGVVGASVTGSGSCVFAVCVSEAAADAAAEAARDRGWWAQACSTSPHGVRIVATE
ncbi:MAG: 4-(cytidine 5'-diphospho)-2-C-methyl-D-erythritol kinase [Coriobacteriia bacterium]|nr:4-(cytidine 5'-diphospho)-2-C-methyl-D-erythritol kinase [Coriobacteriia bacterium]